MWWAKPAPVRLSVHIYRTETIFSQRKFGEGNRLTIGEGVETTLAGVFAFAVFAMGIIGTGLLSVPVLAGLAAYALGEARRWPVGLARKPKQGKAFYATIAVAMLGGAALNFAPINPIKALFWSAVINGVVAVPVMAVMMLMGATARSWVSSRSAAGS